MKNTNVSNDEKMNVTDALDMDELLHASLKPDWNPSDELNQKILREARRREQKKVTPIWKTARRAVATAAVILVCGTVGFGVAGGRLKYTVRFSDENVTYDSYDEVAEAEDDAGFTTYIPETLGEDYAFTDITVAPLADMDEDGNVIDKRMELRVAYEASDGEDLQVNISAEDETQKVFYVSGYEDENGEEDESGYTTTREVEGQTVTYYNDTFVYAPSDYELTEEEARRENEDTHFYVFYGGVDEVTYTTGQSVEFVIDGHSYVIQVVDSDITEDELYELAAEIIKGASQ